MTDLRTAAQQALEALEGLRLNMSDSVLARSLDKRIDNLKAALAEPVQIIAQAVAAEREAILQMSREQWFRTQADFEEAIRARNK